MDWVNSIHFLFLQFIMEVLQNQIQTMQDIVNFILGNPIIT